jgi:hypothetical protein
LGRWSACKVRARDWLLHSFPFRHVSRLGAFGRILVNLSVIKAEVDSGDFNLSHIFDKKPVEDIVQAWETLKGKGGCLICPVIIDVAS